MSIERRAVEAGDELQDRLTRDWNGEAGLRWLRHQELLDRLLAPFLEAGLAVAAARAGETVLDVGCGCGASTLALADRVGAGGSVLGVDISSPMLDRARLRATEAGSIARFANEDAAQARFPVRFDLLFSRFGVMFFVDPEAAFGHLHAAMAPGGRLVFVCWRRPSENDWIRLPIETAAPFLPPIEPIPPDAPGPFALADADRLCAVLTAAGWRSLRLSRLDHRVALGDRDGGDPVESALADVMRAGPLEGRLHDVEEPQRQRALDAVRSMLLRTEDASGLGLNSSIWIVEASA